MRPQRFDSSAPSPLRGLEARLSKTKRTPALPIHVHVLAARPWLRPADARCENPWRRGVNAAPAVPAVPATSGDIDHELRAAIRRVFLEHVIGGKGLSKGHEFGAMVQAPTPDAVLDGVASVCGLGGDDRATLYSSTEYKKIRLHYFTPDYAEWENKYV